MNKAKEIHERAIVVDGHNHMMMPIGKRRYKDQRAVFSTYYAPLLRKGGVNVIMTNIGGDNTCLTNDSDLMLWGSLWIMDMIWQEAEESNDTLRICLSCADIDEALEEGKVAALLTMEGGRPLEGKPNYETLVGLRTFYKLGLRGLQLVDNGRNRIADGKGEARTRGGLTNFGISVVKEMNRLGMLIDVAHITEPGFWDVMELSKDPVIDSHSMARRVYGHIRNLTDEQLKAIAEKGGVIGLSGNVAFVCDDTEKPSIDLFVDHADHIAGLVGIDHVGLGPDFFEFPGEGIIAFWPPGWNEGVFHGVRDSMFAENYNDPTGMPLLTEAFVKRGYSDEEILKVLGGNWLRVYRQVIG